MRYRDHSVDRHAVFAFGLAVIAFGVLLSGIALRTWSVVEYKLHAVNADQSWIPFAFEYSVTNVRAIYQGQAGNMLSYEQSACPAIAGCTGLRYIQKAVTAIGGIAILFYFVAAVIIRRFLWRGDAIDFFSGWKRAAVVASVVGWALNMTSWVIWAATGNRYAGYMSDGNSPSGLKAYFLTTWLPYIQAVYPPIPGLRDLNPSTYQADTKLYVSFWCSLIAWLFFTAALPLVFLIGRQSGGYIQKEIPPPIPLQQY